MTGVFEGMTPWVWAIVLGGLCGVVGTRIGLRIATSLGDKVTLPLCQTALGYVAFAASWARFGPVEAFVAELGWALGASLVAVAAFRRDPSTADRVVWRAASYRDDMLDWLRTGEGPPARPLATCVAHARELAVYVVLGVISANVLAMAAGAALLNFMNAWVATLSEYPRVRGREGVVRRYAWPPWSVVRVIAYVAIGTALAAPGLALSGAEWARVGDGPFAGVPVELVAAGAVGVGLDLMLKLFLAPGFMRRLAASVELPPPTADGGAG